MDKFCVTCGTKICKENKTGYCRICSNKRPEVRQKNSEGLKKAHKEGRKTPVPSWGSEKGRQTYIERKKIDFLKHPLVHRSTSAIRNNLLLSGRECKCETCGVSDWRGQKLSLEIHHIDGDRFNNSLDNLQFLCPNCHSQTKNYKTRNSKRQNKTVTDEELLAAYKKYGSAAKAFKILGLAGAGNYNRLYNILVEEANKAP